VYGCNAFKREDGTWDSPAMAPLVLDGVETWACPRRPLKDKPREFSELLAYYRSYKLGVFPDDGNVASQSARGWKLLSLLDSFLTSAQAERMENTRNGH
jgi:hypothetical protein